MAHAVDAIRPVITRAGREDQARGDKALRRVRGKLESVRKGEHTLLDQTAIVLGSNLGDTTKPPPLCNLFVSYLQHLGIETDRFSTGKGTMHGLEFA